MKAEQKEQYLIELFDVIKGSQEFKTLKNKTQVLNLGVEDKTQGITTRASHSEQVADNAGRLVENAGGTREEIALAKLCGISHDLGHTPMGHDGEAALSELVKKAGYDRGFRHSQYGAKVFAKIFDRYCNEQLQGAEARVLSNIEAQEIRDKVEYLRSQKSIVEESIRNHDVYYAHQIQYFGNEEERKAFMKANPEAKTENLVENSTRLADSLSFMSSDMQDLMRGKLEDGKTVISTVDVKNFFEELKKDHPEDFDKLKSEEYIKAVEKGKKGIEAYQKQMCGEVASHPTPEGRLETISDEYKYTREITTLLKYAEKYPDKRETFLKYAVDKVKDYDKLHENEVGYINLSSGDVTKLDALKKDISIHDNQTEIEGILKQYCEDNKIDTRMNAERAKLWEEKPAVATVYELQDEKQYNDILLRDRTEVLHNNKEETNKAISKAFSEKLEEGKKLSSDVKVVKYTEIRAVDYAIQEVQKKTNQQLIPHKEHVEVDRTKREMTAQRDVSNKPLNERAEKIERNAKDVLSKESTMKSYEKQVNTLRAGKRAGRTMSGRVNNVARSR